MADTLKKEEIDPKTGTKTLRTYHPDNKTVCIEVVYVGGTKDGFHRCYYPNGVLYNEVPIKDDKPHGKWVYYHKDGVTVESEINFCFGTAHVGHNF